MTKMMINENMREEVIDAIAEWMTDNEEFSIDFLRSHGEDWLHVYSLDEMYTDYCGGDLADVINMFNDNNMEADNWGGYFVDDNGDLHEEYDMGEVVSEMVFDDNKYAEWVLEEIEEGLIDEPQSLMEIVEKYATPSWEDVNSDIVSAQCTFLSDTFEAFTKSVADGEATAMTFGGTCHNVVAVHTVGNCLIKTKCYGADESMYQKICDDLANDNLLCVIATDADEYVQSMNVSFEKAVEIVVKNEYLEGRWF